MMVFVHISDDAVGTYVGNGGIRSMTSVAQAIGDMGYQTHVFGQEDKLTWDKFRWLSWDKYNFDLVPTRFLSKQKGEFVVVTCWLNRLLSHTRLLKHIPIEQFRYYERGELTRGKYKSVGDFIRRNFPKIAINNRSLAPYYVQMGFKKIIYLENWFRPDLFYFDADAKVKGSVGFQRDSANREANKVIDSSDLRLIMCVGNQRQVAKRMRKSDFYIFANKPKGAVTLFRGETFGNSLYEAMAAGCVCVAIQHDGNNYLQSVIPLVKNVSEAVAVVKSLSGLQKDAIRARSLELVMSRFRLDEEKRENIERFLE